MSMTTPLKDSSEELLEMARRHGARLARAVRRRTWPELLREGTRVGLSRWRLRDCDQIGAFARAVGPITIDNHGEIVLGDEVLLESTVTPISFFAHAGARILVGARTYMNFGVCIEARDEVRIGAGCHLGQYVQLMDNDQHSIGDHRARPPSRPVVLEDGVWLGARTIVLRGVTIGAGTTVGAGSVVTRSLPAGCVAAGAPARVLKRL